MLEEDTHKYTKGVVTLYYRAPEIITGHDYDHKSDMWSLGCIFAELFNFGKPILPGKNEEHQFELICSVIGRIPVYVKGFPTNDTWPAFFSDKTRDLSRYKRYTFYKENKIRQLFPALSELGLHFLMNLLVWDPSVGLS